MDLAQHQPLGTRKASLHRRGLWISYCQTIVCSPGRLCTPTGINVLKKIYKKILTKLNKHITKVLAKSYGQQAKALQAQAVFNLVKGCNTFILEGNGYVKYGIAMLFYKRLPVDEKLCAVQAGVYQFVYLSPKIFLNSKIFQEIHFSHELHNRVALVVVDEAHMIYVWVLVESNYGIFRPSDGKLGVHLLFRNEKPILLILTHDSIVILCGELTRPEICVVRAPMTNYLSSALDVIQKAAY
ncbi:hypothetical protein VP01_2501g2 [Puccinia sorghi]|uniref:Helicase ATP-binding domain-containing protein n=1 Tax=Puccinia sorghi TaxID=27349 RepID=A0A0L6V6A2_9BASI|nr:hypothetical protein VP01_2501g2 [Puccinia sorghi]